MLRGTNNLIIPVVLLLSPLLSSDSRFLYVPSPYRNCSKFILFQVHCFLLQTAFLEVVIPPDIINEETSGDMMVPEGGSAKLTCKARGFPQPKVVWKREDGAAIIIRTGPNSIAERLAYVEGEVLMLTKVTRSEMGAYLCIAANGVPPSVSKRMMLHVHCE